MAERPSPRNVPAGADGKRDVDANQTIEPVRPREESTTLRANAAQAQMYLEAILASLSDALLVVDASGKVVLVNPALEELVARPAEEMLGRPFTQVIELEGGPAPCIIERILQPLPTPGYYETWLYSASGEEIPVRLTCGSLPGEEGQPCGAMILLHDTRYLKEIDHMREDLTNMLVHDLKGPLAAVLASTQLLRQYPLERLGQDLLQELLAIIEQNAARLARMVEAMLDVQRLESRQFSLEITSLHVQEIVAKIAEEAAPLAAEGEIEVRIDLPPDLPPVDADREVLQRILWNLLDNALKYTPDGGLIHVVGQSVQWPTPNEEPRLPEDLPPGRWVLISVTDTGLGISPEDQERIFGRFVQVRIPRGRRRGIGLGLAFCRLAVEAHGGRIWVESRLGQGSTFSFVLPAALPEKT